MAKILWFENYIAEFGKHDMYSICDLQILDRESFEKKFKHSGMDFRQRRLLWLGVQSSMRNKSRVAVMKQTFLNNGERSVVQNRDIAKESHHCLNLNWFRTLS